MRNRKSRLFSILTVVSAALAVAMCAFAVFQFVEIRQTKTDAASASSALTRLTSGTQTVSSEYEQLNESVASLQSQLAVKTALAAVSSAVSSSKATRNTGPKIAYLTFDDGPSRYTTQLLQALKDADVKATFFVIGKNCEEYPTELKAITEAGHVVGVHSWTHDMNYIYSDINNFRQDYQKLVDYLTQQLGQKPTICRFPGGTNNTRSLTVHGGVAIMPDVLQAAADMGLRPIDWDADASDATTPIPTTAQVVQNVMKTIGSNHHPVVLMHDFGNRTSTIEAVPQIVSQLKQEGYTFATLSADVTTAPIFKPAASRVKQ